MITHTLQNIKVGFMELVSYYYAALPAALIFLCTTLAAIAAWVYELMRIKKLRANDRAKTEFFSDITHELKTPVSIILGAIQLMEAKRGDPAVNPLQAPAGNSAPSQDFSRDLGIMKRNCYRMLKLANNLLDVSRAEAGYCTLQLSVCNLTEFIGDLLISIQPYAAQKGLNLLFEPQSESITAPVDMEKMERIILNLLSNAIKFTNPGGTVKVVLRSEDTKVKISVIDTGVGIQKDMQAKIFERFGQVGSIRTRNNEGSGIGLALVKSFTELHGGKIRVTSELGKGSDFTLILPVISPRLAELETGYRKQKSGLDPLSIEFSDTAST
jgi:signal transduction histidine kinase